MGQPHFRFVKMSGVSLGIGRVVGLNIDRAVLTGMDIVISFLELFL